MVKYQYKNNNKVNQEMFQRILEGIIGLVILALLIYGVFITGKWVVGLFNHITPSTLALISLSFFLIPFALGFLAAALEIQATVPMSIALIMIPFSVVGLLTSFAWFLII